jgi:uncharacterized protein (TIGR02145 family)
MKKIMKKQCKKIPSWGCKVFLSVALISLAVVAHAQGADVCYGKSYTIASAMDASGATTYQWLENGRIIPGAKVATYVVPSNLAVGNYTFIRQAKSEDCDEWQSSNEFTVTVYNCSFSAGTATGATATFIDPRDGKRYKTVVMPDGRTWFAQNLNYTKDLTYNAYAYEANGKQFNVEGAAAQAIGSYWCPPRSAGSSVASGDEAACNMYGALYTWETALMVDGKYADDTKSSTAWDESWVSPYYTGANAPSSSTKADINLARGGVTVKNGGRGICPMGWHVPTDREWSIMLDAINGTNIFQDQLDTGWLGSDEGVKLKSANTLPADVDPAATECGAAWYYYEDSYSGTDLTGFSAVPASQRRYDGSRVGGTGYNTCWPSSSGPHGPLGAWYHALDYNQSTVLRNRPPRSIGSTVRCLRDS